MSQARVQTSTFAARLGATIQCGHCQRAIEKGEKYRWFKVGFRSRYKHIRCFRSDCTPRMSELESSLLSGAYSAIEGAEDTLRALDSSDPEDDTSNIDAAVNEAADGVREVADQYREAADAMGSAGEALEEKAQEIEDAVFELESFSVTGESEPDYDQCDDSDHDESTDDDGKAIEPVERGDSGCSKCMEIKQDWWTSAVQEGFDALSNVSL